MADTTKRAFDRTTTSPLVCVQHVSVYVCVYVCVCAACECVCVCVRVQHVCVYGVCMCVCGGVYTYASICMQVHVGHDTNSHARIHMYASAEYNILMGVERKRAREEAISQAFQHFFLSYTFHSHRWLALECAMRLHVPRSDITVKPNHMTSHTHYLPLDLVTTS